MLSRHVFSGCLSVPARHEDTERVCAPGPHVLLHCDQSEYAHRKTIEPQSPALHGCDITNVSSEMPAHIFSFTASFVSASKHTPFSRPRVPGPHGVEQGVLQ
jgi:hypothetical protein